MPAVSRHALPSRPDGPSSRCSAGAEHLRIYGREGRTYALRLDGDFARARLHHPTFRGTSTDAATLFELTPTRLERAPEGRGGPSATFEAPVTGWYRLTVRGIPATSPTIGNPYPEPYTVRFAEGPVRMPDLPEIPEWAGR
jgi:hypothetical protein